MVSRRQRPVLVAAVMVLLVWGCALGGYLIARSTRMTAEKVAAYLHSVDLSRLSGAARAAAIRELAAKLNALSPEERRKARLEREWRRWFDEMTDVEKGAFIDATAPTGFKQMLAAFEQLPPDKRRKTIDDALKRLREARDRAQAQPGDSTPDAAGTNGPPVLDEALRQKMTTIGLKTFYGESSAQTKAELAPVLEEIQRTMESGAVFRERH
ncbi:MAG: hypothetical protein KGS61_06340 [Verrucomicrobia bacterium]|nr:hypothetical protein [Verrucomicrobiota bacterium]